MFCKFNAIIYRRVANDHEVNTLRQLLTRAEATWRKKRGWEVNKRPAMPNYSKIIIMLVEFAT